MHNIPRMTADRLRKIADSLRSVAYYADELRAHADELEKREKAGVDVPVEGMSVHGLWDYVNSLELALRDSRNLLREAEARGDEWKRVANERGEALREAQARLSELLKTPETPEWEELIRAAYRDGGDGALRINRITAEYNAMRLNIMTARNDALEEAARIVESEHWKHLRYAAEKIREAKALARQPPQTAPSGETKEKA